MSDMLLTGPDLFPETKATEDALQWIEEQAGDLAKFFDLGQEKAVEDIVRLDATETQATAILARQASERTAEYLDRSRNFEPQPAAPAPVVQEGTPSPVRSSPYSFTEEKPERPVVAPPGALYARIETQEKEELRPTAPPSAPAPAQPRSVATQGKTGRLMGLSIAGVVILIVLFVAVTAVVGGKEEAPQQETAAHTKKLLEEMKTYDHRDIRNMQERKEVTAPQEAPLPAAQNPTPETPPSAVGTASPAQPRLTKGANYIKDREIIEQYKEVNPGAAAAQEAPAASPGGEGNSLRYRPRPFSAGSTGDTKGGVRIIGRESGPAKVNTIDLHNTALKARLKFSIRSSASNSITAEATQDIEGIPAGSIFYGSGSFSNKRTYVQFNKVRIGNAEYEVKAYAISGKDPGIPSEVIEIENNAKITFTSGVMDATGRVLDNLASTATGGATSGIVNDTTGEVKDKNEQERARYEYRVGAGTTFTVYIE